jgi:hypothetical protein
MFSFVVIWRQRNIWMTHKMAEHMINSEWRMKPHNTYIVNDDLKCLCLGEILLQQQDSQSLKQLTMQMKWLAALLECYQWHSTKTVRVPTNKSLRKKGSYTVEIQFSVIIFVVNFLQYYKFSTAVISRLYCYVLNFLKIRQYFRSYDFLWSWSTVQYNVCTNLRDVLFCSVFQARINLSQKCQCSVLHYF